MLNIHVDVTDVVGAMDDLAQRQLPFAISKGLNLLAEEIQRVERVHVRGVMTIRRGPFIDRSIKITRFAKKRALSAEIAIDPAHDILAKFEDGGIKRPAGRALAIPIAARTSKSGIVIAPMRVRNLHLTAHRTSTGRVQLKGLQRTFTVKGPTGGAILQRVGRKVKGTSLSAEIAAGSIRVAYAFKRSVPIPANLLLTQHAQEVVNTKAEAFMTQALEYAIGTAK